MISFDITKILAKVIVSKHFINVLQQNDLSSKFFPLQIVFDNNTLMWGLQVKLEEYILIRVICKM